MWWKVLGWASLVFFGARALVGLTVSDRGTPAADAAPRPANVDVRIGGQAARIRTMRVTRDDWGDRWPFTVDDATLICVPDLAEYGIFYAVGGHAFAANGASQTMARLKMVDVHVDGAVHRPVPVERGDPLWADGKSIGVMIDAVMKLGCQG